MHDTALEIGRQFFRAYFPEAALRILDVGSQDINGSLRQYAPRGSVYIGIDLCEGQGVDFVLDDPYAFPFADEHFDAIVSTSCLEHDQMYWLTFLEMARVAKAGGYIYLNVPSNGPYHCCPTDNWRFYPDAGLALVSWARRQGSDLWLVESLTARRRTDRWNDCVMVFRKGCDEPSDGRGRLAACFPQSYNVRVDDSAALINASAFTEDMLLLAEAQQQLASGQAALQQLQGERAGLAQAVIGLQEENRTLQAQTASLEEENHSLKSSLEAHAEQIRLIEESTVWRATAVLRRAAAWLPQPVRRSLRHSARRFTGL